MAQIIWDAPVPPDDLTWYMRAIPVNSDLGLSRAASITYSQSHTIRWGEVIRRNRLAKYRSWDGRMPVSNRDEGSSKEVRLAPFSNSLNESEYERLNMMFMQMQGGNKAALADALYSDADRLIESMHNRVEMALGQVLTTRKFSVNENGTAFEADFGADAYPANSMAWAVPITDTANCKAADYLRQMGQQFKESNYGARPGLWLFNEKIVPLLLQNAQLVAECVGTQVGKTRISRADLNTWFVDNDLPTQIMEYGTKFWDDETLSEIPVIPENMIALLPARLSDLIEFRYGLSVTALELVNSNKSEFSFADAPGIVGMVVKEGPPYRQFTFVDAVGIPILREPRLVVTAVVKP